MLVSFISCADTDGFGRVDLSSLSDQTLMELLVGDIQRNTMLRDSEGEFLEIHSWNGLTFSDTGELLDIDFDAEAVMDGHDDVVSYIVGPKGSIDLKWIPMTVRYFTIVDLALEGVVETRELPEHLEYFDISANIFRGTFCIASLPQKIQSVKIASNLLDGTLDMVHLPPHVTLFVAEFNRFHGSLDFSDLPKNIVTLRVGFNDFQGTVDLSKIPSKMRFFAMQSTKVKQDQLVVRVPDPGVEYFYLTKANFGSIVDTSGKDLKKVFF